MANEFASANLTSGQMNALVKRCGGEEMVYKMLSLKFKIVFDSILTFQRTVSLPAQPAIVTTEKFWNDAGVHCMGRGFKFRCLGIVTTTTPALEVVVHKLEVNPSAEAHIIAERGDKARIPLSQVAAFLAANTKSSEHFIFYPEELRQSVVFAHWDSVLGWMVGADIFSTSHFGDCVVSRK